MVHIDLTGKTAIVTGAGKGLGRAMALRLGEAGASTVVSDLELSAAEAVADEIVQNGGIAIGVQTDVTSETQVAKLVGKAVETYKTIDILVNNAGISIAHLFLDTDIEEFDRQLQVNLKGTYFTCKAALPHMIENGEGKIINTASMATKAPSAFHSLYGATKSAIISMTQAIAAEYGPMNIKANCICPGIIRTNMWEITLGNITSVIGGGYDELWEEQVKRVPLGRPQSPEDIANTVLFLASDLAENISAQAININGGQLGN